VKKGKSAFALLIVFLFVLPAFTLPVVNAAEDYWDPKTPMHVARSALGVAVVNGKIYAIGGSNDSGHAPSMPGYSVLDIKHNLDTNEEYDPVKSKWTFKEPMPTPRMDFATAVYQNKIFCIGGKTENGSTGLNEVYDPTTDTWDTKASMPSAEGWLTANVVGNKIYVMCQEGTNYVYSPDSDSWDTKEPVPSNSFLGYATSVFEDKIFVFGGKTENLEYNMSYIYDPETDAWSSVAPIPIGVVSSVAVATTGVLAPPRIYVISSQNVAIYDVENDSWTFGTNLPATRHYFGAAVIDDTIYAIGGHIYHYIPGDFAPVATNEQYTPIGYIPEFPSWIVLFLFFVVSLVGVVAKRKVFRSA
jgi:N-acetylneuraminic acid mutarotase